MEQGIYSTTGTPEESMQEGGMPQPSPMPEVPSPSICRLAKQQLSKLGLRYLIGSILIFVLQTFVVMAVGIWKPEWLTGTGTLVLGMVPMYLIGIPILYLMVRKLPNQEPTRHRMGGGKFVLAAMTCYALVFISNLIGTLGTTIISLLKGGAVENVVMDLMGNTNWVIMAFFTVLCAPVIEELVFRKLIVDRTLQYGEGVAVLVSGLMFGLFHGNLNQFIYAFVLGCALAFLYVKTGNVKITIGIHMFINFLGSFMGMLVLHWIDMDTLTNLQEMMLGGAMDAEVMSALMGILPGLIVYLVYLCLLMVIVLVGGILLIVAACQKKIKLQAGEVPIPKGKRFTTVICNPGMIAYCVFWIAMIVFQLFA